MNLIYIKVIVVGYEVAENVYTWPEKASYKWL